MLGHQGHEIVVMLCMRTTASSIDNPDSSPSPLRLLAAAHELSGRLSNGNGRVPAHTPEAVRSDPRASEQVVAQ